MTLAAYRAPLNATRRVPTASQVRPAHDATPAQNAVRITAENIARATGTPLRTVQHRLSAWRKRWHELHGGGAGCPVERSSRPGVGGVQWTADLDAYCARVGLAADDVLDALGRAPLTERFTSSGLSPAPRRSHTADGGLRVLAVS